MTAGTDSRERSGVFLPRGMFFQGTVELFSQRHGCSRFRVLDSDAIIEIESSARVRINPYSLNSLLRPYFEIIAPGESIRVLEGEVPATLLKKNPLELGHELAPLTG